MPKRAAVRASRGASRAFPCTPAPPRADARSPTHLTRKRPATDGVSAAGRFPGYAASPTRTAAPSSATVGCAASDVGERAAAEQHEAGGDHDRDGGHDVRRARGRGVPQERGERRGDGATEEPDGGVRRRRDERGRSVASMTASVSAVLITPRTSPPTMMHATRPAGESTTKAATSSTTASSGSASSRTLVSRIRRSRSGATHTLVMRARRPHRRTSGRCPSRRSRAGTARTPAA